MHKAAHSTPILQCRNLTKIVQDAHYPTTILKQLAFNLYAQESIAILGASGSGKSTLLHILGGLDQPTSGTVRLLDHELQACNNQQLTQIRSQYIGFVYQFHHLLPELSLMENVAMPLLIQGETAKRAKEQALSILTTLGLVERAHHRPSYVSGGERQRTAVARAMITQPRFILADEPTGNLDNANAHRLIDVLLSQTASVVVVTHDHTIARRMDKQLKLENGQLISLAKEEVIEKN